MEKWLKTAAVWLVMLTISFATASCTSSKVELTVSAAASLTDALKEIQTIYESKHENVEVHFNFGGSGTLQHQIERGAPADLFLSAATRNMDILVDKQWVAQDQRISLLGNELVCIVPANDEAIVGQESDLTNTEIERIAIGIPESVPAGSYAKEALTNAKLWEVLQPKLVQAKDVRQVLQYVETGNVEAGFVYRTDALTSNKVQIAFAVNPSTYTPIVYPVGIVKTTEHGKEAEALYDFLQTREAMDIFKKYGFSMPRTP